MNATSKCKICGVVAHGYHFGAVTCRACAAFFKRALFAKRFRKSCKFDENCTDFVGSGNNPPCKSCRMKKCLEAGMNSENIQAIQTTKLPKSLEIAVIPSIQFTKVKMKQRNYIDVNYLVAQAYEILKFGPSSPLNPDKSDLERMTIRTLKSPGNSKRLEFLGRTHAMKLWEADFLSAAKWLTNFQEFNRLPPGLQMQLLQTIWHVWARAYKLIATSELLKNKKMGLHVFQLCDDFYVELNNTRVDVSWIAKCGFEELRCLLYGKDCNWDLEKSINEVLKLNLTDVELTYLIAQLSFQYAANRFLGTQISEICEKFQEILANDLHKYYTSDLFRDKNYAGRLAQIMKINQEIQRSIRKLRDKTLIANTFDIFIVDFSHPEMFVDTGCAA